MSDTFREHLLKRDVAQLRAELDAAQARAQRAEAEVARLSGVVSASWDVCSRPGGCIPGRPW